MSKITFYNPTDQHSLTVDSYSFDILDYRERIVTHIISEVISKNKNDLSFLNLIPWNNIHNTKFSEYDNDYVTKVKLSDLGVEFGTAVTGVVDLSTLNKGASAIVFTTKGRPMLFVDNPPIPTDIATLTIRISNDEDQDPELLDCKFGPDSPKDDNPHDCKFGDRMTVAEAIEKGWRTAYLY